MYTIYIYTYIYIYQKNGFRKVRPSRWGIQHSMGRSANRRGDSNSSRGGCYRRNRFRICATADNVRYIPEGHFGRKSVGALRHHSTTNQLHWVQGGGAGERFGKGPAVWMLIRHQTTHIARKAVCDPRDRTTPGTIHVRLPWSKRNTAPTVINMFAQWEMGAALAYERIPCPSEYGKDSPAGREDWFVKCLDAISNLKSPQRPGTIAFPKE